MIVFSNTLFLGLHINRIMIIKQKKIFLLLCLLILFMHWNNNKIIHKLMKMYAYILLRKSIREFSIM